jgi:hypothetical protein
MTIPNTLANLSGSIQLSLLDDNFTYLDAAVATAITGATGNTFTGKQTFIGSSTNLSSKFVNSLEAITVSATGASGVINFDVTTQSILYYTNNATSNFSINLRGSTGVTLDSLMSNGEAISVVFAAKQGATGAFYCTNVTVDGATGAAWQGGSAPTSGNTNSIDAYTVTAIKTGAATWTIWAGQTQFK